MAYNILIVDDSLPMRGVIKKIIKASRFDVGQFYEAANGREALSLLNEQWLDLVLTDYNMPDMNGLDLLEHMQHDELFKAIPVVMITTEGSRVRVEEFIAKGASGYIKKPFTPEQVKAVLTDTMGERCNDEPNDGAENINEGFDF